MQPVEVSDPFFLLSPCLLPISLSLGRHMVSTLRRRQRDLRGKAAQVYCNPMYQHDMRIFWKPPEQCAMSQAICNVACMAQSICNVPGVYHIWLTPPVIQLVQHTLSLFCRIVVLFVCTNMQEALTKQYAEGSHSSRCRSPPSSRCHPTHST